MMSEKDSTNLFVLVVEDADDARHLMRLGLEELGYVVLEADNGVSAVEIALRERPNIILMDLSLPIMDGLEATMKIRSDEHMRDTQIIAVTAHQEADFREGAKASGFDAYVTKPIDFEWLSELIKGLLV
ncbi:MAG: response regulator [bacterium]